MFSRLTILLLLSLFLTACRIASGPTPTATAEPETAATLTATSTSIPATPSPTTPSATPINLQYVTVYQKDGFSIRQAFLGPRAIWQWDDFPMPPTRIQNTLKNLELGHQMVCDKPGTSSTPCSQSVTLAGNNEYTLRMANAKGGSALLTKNGKLLWTGVTNGADSFAILSSRALGGELVFDYAKSNWGSNEKRMWVTDLILLTSEKTVQLIPDAFGPNIVNSKLIYFKVKLEKDIIVFDGSEVGDTYDYIFNMECCWHGPPLNLAADGKIIDFFAQKDNGWYHVQAGYLPGQ